MNVSAWPQELTPRQEPSKHHGDEHLSGKIFEVRLLTYRKDCLIHNVECATCMYKVIMHLATINSVVTTQAFCDNLHVLGAYASTVIDDND